VGLFSHLESPNEKLDNNYRKIQLNMEKKYKAVITVEGTPGQNEPCARLEDGRVMPMGWNMNQTIPNSTKGTAKYVSTPNRGLWLFEADK
jgi:hypothetical protein